MNQRKPVGARGASQAGSTMVVVALLMAAVAMLSLSFLAVLRSSQKESQGSRETLSALYVCEAGLTAAVDDLARGGTGVLGTKSHPVALGAQSYWVESTDIGAGRTQLDAYGTDERSRLGIQLVVQRTPRGFFRWAAFGAESLHLEGDARTDGYDSSLGSYLSQQVNGSGPGAYANSTGDVASNADIAVDSSLGVWGDANPGPTGSVSGNLANVSGNTTPLGAALQLPPILVPSIAPCGALEVDSAEVLQSGSYHYSSLEVKDGKTLTIIGPATVVCDAFRMRANTRIEVDAASGPVQFYVLGDFQLDSGVQIAANTSAPMDVSFNLQSDNIQDPDVDIDFDADEVDLDSTAQVYATLYAPNAEISIDNDFQLYGALVARRLTLGANSSVHYDEHLATVCDDSDAAYQRLCWRIVALP